MITSAMSKSNYVYLHRTLKTCINLKQKMIERVNTINYAGIRIPYENKNIEGGINIFH
jgi:hypothetical protein